MNPQILFLKKYGMLQLFENLILGVLGGNWCTSRQLANLIAGDPLVLTLENLLEEYPKSGFREISSFAGSVASRLSQGGSVSRSMIFRDATAGMAEHAFRLV